MTLYESARTVYADDGGQKMWRGKTVSVVFPAYNEESNIRVAVMDFFVPEIDEVIVVDNNSSDGTVQEVARTEARLVREAKQGYGNALRRGMREATGDYVILAEPDGTFQGADIYKLLAYADDFDLVLGTRTARGFIGPGANMGAFIRWGNWAVGKMMQVLFRGPSLSDVGCTMRLIKRDRLEALHDQFQVGGSHFSPEMMMVAILNRLRVVEIPLRYGKRIGTSKITGSKINAFKLGLRMIGLIWRYRLTRRKRRATQ